MCNFGIMGGYKVRSVVRSLWFGLLVKTDIDAKRTASYLERQHCYKIRIHTCTHQHHDLHIQITATTTPEDVQLKNTTIHHAGQFPWRTLPPAMARPAKRHNLHHLRLQHNLHPLLHPLRRRDQPLQEMGPRALERRQRCSRILPPLRHANHGAVPLHPRHDPRHPSQTLPPAPRQPLHLRLVRPVDLLGCVYGHRDVL
ncbi:hypothetical protein BU24DRAFT_453253 [Aaosphaeria arxii CBS 175.79]|uniref:Uncharacterized protein n=1 Tax=Aaosphaeria arxii CBS 175.79 TaxID=1450172 RepID=A0A6A5XJC0_9PLEO|nr:uncharacterized protein BU24DRAFT_453253 [Aaosphaeria arxii CBS 175.79]KAF2012959.1 hypothetical protein BU24DRAFT_453253 [Aaosphaeria arxii CBS 175.79]